MRPAEVNNVKLVPMQRAGLRGRGAEDGLTLIELMIAILILVVGLVSMAQLFVVATMSQSLAVNQTSGAEDAQRFVDALRVEASRNGIGTFSSGTITYNPNLFSATYRTAAISSCGLSQGNPAFTYHMNCYDPVWFKPSVWIYDFGGNLVNPDGTLSPSSPPGVAATDLRAPSKGSLKVFVRLDPRDESATGRRSNVPISLTAVINGDVGT